MPEDAGVGRPRTVFLAAFAILAALGILWSLATPIFGSPDENAHVAKAVAQLRGDVLGHQQEGVEHTVVALPDSYRYSPQIVCFAYEPRAHAGCGVELGDEGTDWFASWVVHYNPVYYYLVGWPSLFLDGSAGVYGMRVVGTLLNAALLAAAAAAAVGARRAIWMPAALAFLASPMVLFLGSSVNPQGTEFAAGALLTIALLRLAQTYAPDSGVTLGRRVLWPLVTVAAILVVVSRAIGPLWVALLVAGVLTAVGWRTSRHLFLTRASYPWIGTIAAGGLFSLGWTVATGMLGTQAEASDAPLVGSGFFAGAWAMLRDGYRWLQEAAGVFGWLDTPLPAMAYVLYFGAVILLLVLAVVGSGRRDRRIVLIAAAAAILVPVVVQAASVSRTGIIWQGRYSLILYLAVILIAAWALSRESRVIDPIAPRVSIVIATLVGVYGVVAYAVVLHRYVVGSERSVADMLSAPSWQPPLGWQVLIGLYVLVSAALVIATSRLALRVAAPAER